MHVLISADIEGVTGTVSWRQAGSPTGDHYDWPFARRMMTHDVNAAIRGAREAGATRIVVKDSHGNSKNLLVDELEDGVELISGLGTFPEGMVTGVSSDVACCVLVGYHAMAGTAEGVMEHTITGSVRRLSVNGSEWGEMAMAAATCGSYGVPVVAVTSDDKGTAEAAHMLPGVQTATVKHGMGRYMGRLLHPSVTGPLIQDTVAKAVAGSASVAPFVVHGPLVVELEHNKTEETEAASTVPGWAKTGAHIVRAEFPDWKTALPSVWRAMMSAASSARWMD